MRRIAFENDAEKKKTMRRQRDLCRRGAHQNYACCAAKRDITLQQYIKQSAYSRVLFTKILPLHAAEIMLFFCCSTPARPAPDRFADLLIKYITITAFARLPHERSSARQRAGYYAATARTTFHDIFCHAHYAAITLHFHATTLLRRIRCCCHIHRHIDYTLAYAFSLPCRFRHAAHYYFASQVSHFIRQRRIRAISRLKRFSPLREHAGLPATCRRVSRHHGQPRQGLHAPSAAHHFLSASWLRGISGR